MRSKSVGSNDLRSDGRDKMMIEENDDEVEVMKTGVEMEKRMKV